MEQNIKDKLQEIIQNDKGHNYYDDDGNCLFYYESVEAIAEQSYNLALEDRWISVETALPEIGVKVLVRTYFMSNGKPESETFVGYMDEYGDLFSLPEDDNYGWEFNDCVTHWMPLPSPNTESK